MVGVKVTEHDARDGLGCNARAQQLLGGAVAECDPDGRQPAIQALREGLGRSLEARAVSRVEQRHAMARMAQDAEERGEQRRAPAGALQHHCFRVPTATRPSQGERNFTHARLDGTS